MKTTIATLLLSLLSLPAFAAPDPWGTGSPSTSRVAILVEGAGDAERRIEAAARDAVSDADVIDAGSVRAARAFLAIQGDLDDNKAERLRQEIGADRLVVLHIRAEGRRRYVVARALDANGPSGRKYGESDADGIEGAVHQLVLDLPSPGREGSDVSMAPRAPRPASAAAGSALGPYVSVDVFLGQKQMKRDDWKPVEDQLEFGIAGTFGAAEWPAQIAADLYRSSGSKTVDGYNNQTLEPIDIDVEGTSTEIALGARKIFVVDMLRPHVGAGVAMISADFHARADGYGSQSESGNGTGVWVAAGAMMRAGDHVDIGLLARWSTAQFEVGNLGVDGGGLHFGLTIGGAFGSASGR